MEVWEDIFLITFNKKPNMLFYQKCIEWQIFCRINLKFHLSLLKVLFLQQLNINILMITQSKISGGMLMWLLIWKVLIWMIQIFTFHIKVQKIHPLKQRLWFCWYQDFFQKISISSKNNTFTQSNSMSVVLEIF